MKNMFVRIFFSSSPITDEERFSELLIKLIFSFFLIRENGGRIFWNYEMKLRRFLLKGRTMAWVPKNVFAMIGEDRSWLTCERNVLLVRYWNSPQLRETYGRESITDGATDDFFGVWVRGSWCNVGRSCHLGISLESHGADFFHWLPLWI